MPFPQALLIADDADSASVWENILQRRSIECIHVRYEAGAQTLTLPDDFDLVLIDSSFDSETAIHLCSFVRAKSRKPILLITYETDVRYQLRAYEAGVDDCVVRPVSVLVFLAKLGAWINRTATVHYDPSREDLVASGYRADPKTRRVSTPDGRVVQLSTLEFRLFRLLLANQGHVLQTDFLLSHVWVHGSGGDPRLLSNLVYRLRRKIGQNSSKNGHICRVPGQGYRWDPSGSLQSA